VNPAIRPKVLTSGCRVHVVATSGPVELERLDRGLRWLRQRLQLDLCVAENVQSCTGYFAGSDAVRLAGTRAAVGDVDAAGIMAARGGYGATRLLTSLDAEPLVAFPKLIVGFSDVTALLAWAWVRAGVCGIHGPVVTQLATLCEDDRDRLIFMMRGEDPGALESAEGTVLHGGVVEGPLVAGNLEVLRSLIGTKFMPPLAGTILALEEVRERPYRIDRALTQMLTSGVLRGVRGIALGQFIACEEPEHGHVDSPSALDVVIERLGTLGIPLVTGFPFGHDRVRNAALPFGTRVRLDAQNGLLSMLEPVMQA